MSLLLGIGIFGLGVMVGAGFMAWLFDHVNV